MIPSAAPALVLAIALAQASPTPTAPSPTPAATATPTPTATATPITFGYVVDFPATAATGAPAIREVALTQQTLHSGGPWAIRVTTTPDVTGVSLEAFGLHVAIFRVGESGSGVFAAMGTLPDAPAGYLNRTYTVSVVGTTADGRHATASVSARLVR